MDEIIIFDDGTVGITSTTKALDVKIYKSDANFVERLPIDHDVADDLIKEGVGSLKYTDKLTKKGRVVELRKEE